MNCYFELTNLGVKRVVGHTKYIAISRPTADYHKMIWTLVSLANRVWLEDDSGNVTFFKNKESSGTMPEVDLKEFFWVKLKCEWKKYETYSALSQW
jgi:hypothetical protein